MRERVYVRVIAEVDMQGRVRPLSITWRDGRVYEIDRVLDVREAAAVEAGGHGMRYTVRIRGQETYLFHDYFYHSGWSVEAKA